MTPTQELATLLRPAGAGLYLVSTGAADQAALQRRLYDAATAEEVEARFRERLEAVAEAKVVLLGVPSDVGAGFRRGANLGPQYLRTALLDTMPEYRDWARAHGVVDLGDVFVVPQLLHDSMLSEAQLEASRRALYPRVRDAERNTLPVSPLSITERALDLVLAMNPRVRPVILGGDHSCAWPVAAALHKSRRARIAAGEALRPWAIVQPDAHTDLLEERLGVRYCFATWSYHANELLGRGGRLVQVGTRASRRDKAHWENSLGVRQFWAEECRADPAGSLDRLVTHVQSLGVEGVYFSNDIDGTDDAWVDATGTPEPQGLEPDWVVELIRRLGREVGFLAGDLMELAPPLRATADSTERTVAVGARYVRELLLQLVAPR